MKFLVVKNLKKEKQFKPIIAGLLLFMLLYVISDFFVKSHSLGLDTSSLSNSLFGNEEEYLEPMPTSVFLEMWHIEIFLTMMLLLSLGAVFSRFSSDSIFNQRVLHSTMIAALFSLVFLAVAFFFEASFTLAYLITFYLSRMGILYMAIFSLKSLYAK